MNYTKHLENAKVLRDKSGDEAIKKLEEICSAIESDIYCNLFMLAESLEPDNHLTDRFIHGTIVKRLCRRGAFTERETERLCKLLKKLDPYQLDECMNQEVGLTEDVRGAIAGEYRNRHLKMPDQRS